jgi:predicted transcriptional regulator
VSTEKLVKDLMIGLESYPQVREKDMLHEAIGTIQNFTCSEKGHLQFADLLVFDDTKQLVGRLTLQDILRGLEQKLLGKAGVPQYEGKKIDFPDVAILWEESFFRDCRPHMKTTVGEAMSPIKTTVKATATVLKALYVMLQSGDCCVPVLEDDRVVGVVRLEEVFKAICDRCAL